MTDGLAYAGPGVRRLARELGVDLAQVSGSGVAGRVQVEDVHRHVRAAVARPMAGTAAPGHALGEADITGLEEMRARFLARGVAVSRTCFLVKAVAMTLRDFPALGGAGCAIAVIAPPGAPVVIQDAGRKGLAGIAEAMAAGDQVAAGFTILALERLGGLGFTPDAALPALGVAEANIRPVWDGQGFAPRLMLPLSLSWDRGVVDAAEAGRFLAQLAGVLGDITQILL